jgi:hypothetical protein
LVCIYRIDICVAELREDETLGAGAAADIQNAPDRRGRIEILLTSLAGDTESLFGQFFTPRCFPG